MKHTQAVFSVKFEPVKAIRDYGKTIECILKDLYMPLNVLPIPESVFYDVPRMVAESKFKHSQISLSQLSIDIVANFDDEFSSNYEKIATYIKERALLAKEVLAAVGLKDYLYLGLLDNVELDLKRQDPVSFMKSFLSEEQREKKVHEVVLRTSSLERKKFFVNKQYSTFERYNTNFPSQALASFKEESEKVSGVVLSLDINNRYEFLYHETKQPLSRFEEEIDEILNILKSELQKEVSDDERK